MMKVRLTDKIQLELIPSHHGLRNLRLFIDFPAVVAGDYTSKKEYADLYRTSLVTYRGILDYSEEFYFDKHEKLLGGVRLNIPDLQLPADQIPLLWGDMPLRTSGLRLLETADLWLEPTNYHWWEEDTPALVCVYASSLSKGQNYWRLSIADDLQLLFAGEQYCGWMLCQPEQYLVHSWQSISKGQPDQELSALFGEWMHIYTEETFELLSDEEPDILASLVQLCQKIDLNQGAKEQRKWLWSWIYNTAQTFYDEEVVELAFKDQNGQ